LNFPFSFEIVPIDVPFNPTVAKGSVSLVSASVTIPEIVCPESASDIVTKKVHRTAVFDKFIMVFALAIDAVKSKIVSDAFGYV